jgi:hypothetical protein
MGKTMLIVNRGYIGNDPINEDKTIRPLLPTGVGKKKEEPSNQSVDKSEIKPLLPTGFVKRPK